MPPSHSRQPPAVAGTTGLSRAHLLPSLIRSPIVQLTVITVLCLARFIDKPFHIDDPMYLWSGLHILKNPLNFYGFTVNWTGVEAPMSTATQNPPLASYFIAAAALVMGVSEVALHAAFLLPALGAVLGTYFLARAWCVRPMLAALLALFTPVFLLSATTVMSDMLMVCFWIWAVLLWDRGLGRGSWLLLTAAALLIAAASLTKYPGMNLIPLLLVYTLLHRGHRRYWAFMLLLPLLLLAGYQLWTHHLYGRGLLLGAVEYARGSRTAIGAPLDAKLLLGLCFTGGCVASGLFVAPWIWSRRSWLIGLFLLALMIGAAALVRPSQVHRLEVFGPLNWGHLLQIGLWATVGLSILAAAAVDVWRCRSRESVLLALWIAGTMTFAAVVNWSVNGRSILPMAPAAAIVLVRRMEDRVAAGAARASGRTLAAALAGSAGLALAVAWADYALAQSARQAAQQIAAVYADGSRTVWFEGHWGFQYYMEGLGGKAIDFNASRFQFGDVLALALNNSGVRRISAPQIVRLAILEVPTCRWLSTMNVQSGAGFYGDVWGPLPFALGGGAIERYEIKGITGNLAPRVPANNHE